MFRQFPSGRLLTSYGLVRDLKNRFRTVTNQIVNTGKEVYWQPRAQWSTILTGVHTLLKKGSDCD